MSETSGPGNEKVGQQPNYGQQPVTQQPLQGGRCKRKGKPDLKIRSNTTMVITQPGFTGRPPPRPWNSRTFECFSDIPSCLGVFFCGGCCYPCYLSNKFNESMLLPICLPVTTWLLALRVRVRAENNIEGSISSDSTCTNFCYPCVMCQLSREHDYITSQASTY